MANLGASTAWGLVVAASLVAGAVLAAAVELPARLAATITAFGGGTLLAAVALQLVPAADRGAGPALTANCGPRDNIAVYVALKIARPGDVLLLTKPLGSGIVTTAIKRGIAPKELVDRIVEVMAALNRAAGEALAASGAVHALTDVTGFGLLGHAWEMAEGSGVTLRIRAADVPVLEGVHDLAARDVVPGGSKANLKWVLPSLTVAAGLPATTAIVLADAQTNGGLLAAVDPARADAALASLRAAGVAAVAIGDVVAGAPPRLEVA